MKNTVKILSLFLLLVLVLGCVVACDSNTPEKETDDGQLEWVDYASQAKLDMNSSTIKQEATVKQHIDGDTTHFNVPTSVMANGVL